ncbi:MAG: undecaprenyl-phosphate glucose phosphotransferase [Lachnospiraceae bacterium]|nr:undecaprenyl-phosphate glucose phosphotransferase [Lachnospiraceae bacterium]
MIKDNYRYFNRLQVFLDGLIIIISYAASWYLKFRTDLFSNEGNALSRRTYFGALIIIVPLYLIIYTAFSLYTSKRTHSIRYIMNNIIKANVIGLLVYLTLLYVARQQHFSRTMMFIFFGLNIFNEMLLRILIRKGLVFIRKKGFNIKRVLLVGYSRAAEGYIDRVKSNPQWGYQIAGILDDNVEKNTEYKGIRVLGRIDSLLSILPQNSLDEIAITLGLSEYAKFESIVNLCEKSGVHTQFIPDYNRIIPTKPYTEDLQGLPVINIRYVPLNNSINAAIKRMVDIAGSAAGIIVLFPLMILISIAVRCSSKGPLIFKQERVGLHNKTFMMYKFRTMEVQPQESEKKEWTKRNDPRVTSIGKLLRCTSLDELPQLFNIFAGNMSLVGPRPERPFFVEKFKEEIPRYMIKHQVRPGLTGWAQINGYRGDTSINKRIEFDLYYIENWTMWLDFKIMFLTIFKGFINKNAY